MRSNSFCFAGSKCFVLLFKKRHLLVIYFLLFALQSFAQPPTITSFFPLVVCQGDPVYVYGTNFTDAYSVTIGGEEASSFEVINATTLLAYTSKPGYITISTPYGTVYNNLPVSINPEPTANPISNKTFCSGDSTGVIPFSGTANNFYWSNSNPAIGLGSQGKGQIPSFKATNNAAVAISGTITVSPLTSGFAFVPCNNNIAVVNTADNSVDTLISVANNGIYGGGGGVAFSPNGKIAYVILTNARQLYVINTASKEIIKKISFTNLPFSVIADPDGSAFYVAEGGYIERYNAVTFENQWTMLAGNGVSGLAIHKDGGTLYVANAGANTVLRIEGLASTPFVSQTYNVGSIPNGLAFSTEKYRLYVVNRVSGSVTVINTLTNAVIATIPVGTQPFGIAVTPDGSRVYVANGGSTSNNVSVINTATNTVIASIPVGTRPSGIAIEPNGQFAYVTNAGSGTLSVIDVSTNTVLTTLPLSPGASAYGNFISGVNCYGQQNQTFTITVKAPVSVKAPADKVYCEGDSTQSVLLTGTPTGVRYDISGGAAVGLPDQTNVTSIPSFHAVKGNATVTITPKANGCTGLPVTYTITVKPVPSAVISPAGALPICPGTSIGLTANMENGYSYQWNLNGSPIAGSTAFSYSATGPGSYTVTTNLNGCAFTSSPVLLTSANCTGNQIKTGNLPVNLCSGQGLVLPYTVSGTFIEGNSFTAQLSNGQGSFANPINIGKTRATTSGTIDALIPSVPPDVGYRIRVVSSNPVVIGNDNALNIQISRPPIASINPADSVTTYPDFPVTLSADPQGGYSYQWLLDGQKITTNGSASTYKTATAGNYRVIITAPNGCFDTSKITTVRVQPCPDLIITVNSSNATVFSVQVNGGKKPYTYSLDGSNFQAQNTFSNLQSGQDYTVYVKDSVHCTGELTFSLRDPVDCNVQQGAGGQGTTFATQNLGTKAGMVAVVYDMFTIPDQMDVYYNGASVASTQNLVSDKGWLLFDYAPPAGGPANCTIRMYAPESGTVWEYAALCPIADYLPMRNGKDTTCSTVFVSPNFPKPYPANTNLVHTFTPSSKGSKLHVDFKALLLMNAGTLFVYDGPTTASPLLRSFSGGYSYSQNPSLAATNATGQLTFKFVAGSTTGKYGWIANIYCGTYIQSFYPKEGQTGDTITVIGAGFTGATAVRFGGVAALSFEVIADTLIKAVVGNGQSGEVNVVKASESVALGGFAYKTQATLCPNGSQTLLSNVQGASYQWQVNKGGGFINVEDDANHFGSSSENLQLERVPSNWYGYEYRCVVEGTRSSDVTALRFSTDWQGSAGSSDWETTTNWSCGVMPDAYTDVMIRSGKAILNSNQSCHSLQLAPGASLLIKPHFNLQVTGKHD